MNKPKINPELGVVKTFDRLLSSSSPKAQKTLALINEICLEVAKTSRDFSVANIAAISNERGGPSAGAIRNKTGERYRTLIHEYANAYPSDGETLRREQAKSKSWIDHIPDNHQRWRVKEMARQLKEAQAQLAQLRHMVADAGPVIRLADPNNSDIQASLPAPNLSENELRALKAAIDEDKLRLHGMKFDDRGALIDSENKKVVKIGYRTAIEKILTVYAQKGD